MQKIQRVLKLPLLKFTILSFIIVINSFKLLAQDSLQKKIEFTANAKLWIQQNYDGNAEVSMTEYIKSLRKNYASLPVDFKYLSDNPLRHGASYLAIKTKTVLKKKVILNADLYAEHRGVSYGLFERNNVLIYPVFNIEAKDTLKLFKKNFLFTGNVGMFLDEKLDEGLTIFNVDVQGYKLKLEREKWYFLYSVYGDFVNGIGLNIDDINSYACVRKLGKNKDALLGVSFNNNIPLYGSFIDNFSANLFGEKSFKNSKAYFQIGVRPGSIDYFNDRIFNSFLQKAALNIGMQNSCSTQKFKLTNTVEARYYGAIFNENRYNYGLFYRKPAIDQNELYANTVGKYLYPLRKFDTPFSQWAVYTEYAYSSIFSLNVRGTATKQTGLKTDLYINYDINFIHSKNNESVNVGYTKLTSNFIYPFFSAGFNYKIIDEVKAGIMITNKAMNLDISYPTHYLMSRPVIALKVEANF